MARKLMCACQHEKYGYFIDGITIFKTADPAVHKMRTPPGYAVQKSILEHHRQQVLFVEIRERGGRTYRCTVEHFMKHAISTNRLHGDQLLLVDHFWTITSPDAPAGTGPGLQLGLF